MHKQLCNALFITAIAIHPLAHTGDEKTHLKGATCYGTLQKVSCGYIGEVTIKEIYEKGWRVVSLIRESTNTVSLIIEEQNAS